MMKINKKSVVKTCLWVFGILIFLIILKISMRLILLRIFYTPMLEFLVYHFGPATFMTKLTAFIGSILSIMILPTALAVILWGKKKKEIGYGLAILFVVLGAMLFYESQNTFFDGNTGEPIKYYCATIDGIKFSSHSGVDQTSGAEFKLITKDLLNKYQLWQKLQQGKNVPYFDPATGEPNFKYGKNSNGNITLYPILYEFDPATGMKLEFVNAKVVEKYLNNADVMFGATESAINKINKNEKEITVHFNGVVKGTTETISITKTGILVKKGDVVRVHYTTEKFWYDQTLSDSRSFSPGETGSWPIYGNGEIYFRAINDGTAVLSINSK